MVGCGEWIAVVSVAELELALEVGAPQIVGCGAGRQRRSGGAVARSADVFDQAMAVENGMDRAPGWHAHIAGQPPHQEFADLARTPMRLAALEADNQALDLPRQLVGIAHRPARTVGQGFKPMLLVTVEDFIAGFARYAEL